jgi:tRNA (mo5U34)-methyltransferase
MRKLVGSRAMPTPEQAAAFVRDATCVWHQRFELAPGVSTPGGNDIDWLVRVAGLPADLTGKTVLDIGTTNGGAAFALERRGAERVVAVDIFPPEWFGVAQLIELLDSRVEYVRTSVYELADRFPEPFDLVLFWGVLYHLRHPLLALDNVRAVTGGQTVLETAVCDAELRRRDRNRSLVHYYRSGELSDDPSNWFSPSLRALEDWCASSGFGVERIGAWPARRPTRAMLRLARLDGPPEYEQISYERPLRCAAGTFSL